MDSRTQQNAAMVEQSTAAARSLASEASQLLKLVSRFNISRTENATRRPVATPRPMVAVPKATRKPAVKALPVSHGNTALKAEPADEDWTEFSLHGENPSNAATSPHYKNALRNLRSEDTRVGKGGG